MRRLLPLALVALIAGAARAEVADAAANGFTDKHVLVVRAAPDVAYQRFVSVGNWWSSDHTFSGDAKNLTLDAKPMGCWCEKLPGGGGVRHMEVLAAMPGKLLVLSGGLGPLQSLAATGTLRVAFSPAKGGGTEVEVTYAVAGYLAGGMNKWAAPVDGVLGEQLARYKEWVERGAAAK